ncbi:MAG: UDP-3-O-(3-hydroxymyristoyl)glucosamine N-acyltransferase [Candidatus Aminicenantes bacterium]|nr:UDP-3-O-(3-hydroxymyristoyl)glucosamine N-acyltransferase [Candidatus Aminicenantes bacterium]
MPNLKKITELVSGQLHGDPDLEINGIQSLKKATADEIAFIAKDKEDVDLSMIHAGALIVAADSSYNYPNRVLVADPQLAFARLLDFFHPQRPFCSGIAANASISEKARLEKNVRIGPFSYVGENSRIGENTEIHAGVVIYRDVTIGRDCLIYSRVVIRENVEIGDRVIIHPGAVIGADGFGYGHGLDGAPVKIPQKGKVLIASGCEIGANTCIDRSTIEETALAENTKLDNLVQIGHNVRIGKNTVISSQTGISGSTEIGAQVVMGGQVGIADHVKIADGVMIAAKSGVSGSIKSKMIVAGIPHQEISAWRKSMVLLRNLGAWKERLQKIEAKIKEWEAK